MPAEKKSPGHAAHNAHEATYGVADEDATAEWLDSPDKWRVAWEAAALAGHEAIVEREKAAAAERRRADDARMARTSMPLRRRS